jgi:hypothetical protein
MKRSTAAVTLVTPVMLAIIATVSAQETATTTPAVKYSVKVHQFEGCECESVCPCVFSKDTTYGECRAILVFTFDGAYGSTALKDVSCVLVGTKLGKNIEKNIGNWEGVLYVSSTATPEEIAAITDLLHAMVGDAFASLDQRKESIQITRKDDVQELVLGKIARLRVHAMKASNGEMTKIVNAPSPVAFREFYCAIADENKYDDGVSSWDFTGRNGFFTEFDLVSKE